MIKDLWNKIMSYELTRRGKILAGSLLVLIIILIVGWAA